MLVTIYPTNIDERKLATIVTTLKNGGIIIYPTDTVYGMACDLFNRDAIERVCRIKHVKPEKMNFSIICSDLSHISEYTLPFPNPIFRLLKRALPGPYTFILKANNNIPKLFKNNKRTIGIRVPNHPLVNRIVSALGNPLLSTSIHKDDDIIDYYTEPQAIYERYENLADIVIDGGTGGITPSTIIDCTTDVPIIQREGLGSIDIVY